MKKYINALLYGDKSTKWFLWRVLLFGLGTIALVIGGLVTGSFPVVFAGLFAALGDFMYSQSRTLTDEDFKPEREKKEKKAKTGKKEPPKEKASEKSKPTAPKEESPASDTKEEARAGQKGDSEEEDADSENSKKKPKEKTDNNFSIYTEDELQKILKKNRVASGHKEVMIDSCPSLQLKEAPAYMWHDKRHYYLLVVGLNGGPMRLKYDLKDNMKLKFIRAKQCNPQSEYQDYKIPSLITAAFGLYVPDYYQKKGIGGTTWNKNLYLLGDDMYFTNHSAKNVFDVTGASFFLEDQNTMESRHGGDFVEAYKLNVLWKDGVLSSKEYQSKINGLLSEIARSDSSFESYMKTLKQMLEYNFITDEYVEYYENYRRTYRAQHPVGK